MSNTTNYNLTTWSTSETSDSFYNLLFGLAGNANSNMTKIDTQMKSSADSINSIKTSPIKTVLATKASDSYYVATVSEYTAYVTNNLFILKLDVTCQDVLTLNINSIGTVSVMKYKPDGNIYNVSAGDIVANVPVLICFDGTRWIILNDIKSGEISTTTDTTISGILKGSSGKITPAVAGTDYLPMSGGNMIGAINEALVHLALAGTMNIGAAAGNYIIVDSGTGPITAFDSVQAGTRRFMMFSVPTTINYNASTMIIPGAANLSVAAGDVLEWVSGGGGTWRCVNIQPWSLIKPASEIGLTDSGNYYTTDTAEAALQQVGSRLAGIGIDYSATLTSAGWSGSAPYTQTVSISGISSTDTPIVDVILSSTTSVAIRELAAYGYFGKIETGSGQITVTCYENVPTVNINIRLKVIR